jgi:hypothetical protein
MPFSLESILIACVSTRHFDVWLQSALSHLLNTSVTAVLSGKISPHYKLLIAAYLASYAPVVNESKSEARLKEVFIELYMNCYL